jgi:hypothetical protein
MAGNGEDPSSEAGLVARELPESSDDFQPRLGSHVLGRPRCHYSHVPENDRRQVAKQTSERILVAGLGPLEAARELITEHRI